MIDQTAQGLASLGRNGDSMLVHMSPEEVSGLQALGQMTGHKLHTNPYTGMPEAFDFGDFFTSFLPTIVGAAVGGPPGAGFMSTVGAPILAGAATGAGLAAIKGDDPLMGGLMGGFGGYGGAGLGQTFSKAFGGASAVKPTLEGTLPNIGGAGAADALGTNVLQQTPAGMGGLGFGTQSTLPSISPEGVITPATTGVASAPVSPTAEIANNLGDFGTGIKNLSGLNPDMSISDAYGAFTKAGGSAMDLATPIGGGVLAGLEPSDIYGKPNDPRDKDKYDPYSSLNLSNDTGLRLVAKGGYIDGYALGGTVNTNPSVGGGLSDLYNRPEGATTQSISSDGYGIGRLNNLASEQSMNQAKTLGYAMGGLTALKSGGQPGGYLNGDGDGMSDSIPATIEGKQPARLADGEFVIPADVVSHLGNGSSKAGSKRLYAMLDKVRQARTGNKKQGKQIKAEKYLPA